MVQNALIDRFNHLDYEDVSDVCIFENIHQVREISKVWQVDYYITHTDGSLG
jgi:hypothetical protein